MNIDGTLLLGLSGWAAVAFMWWQRRDEIDNKLDRKVTKEVNAAIGEKVMNLIALTNTARELTDRAHCDALRRF